MIGVGTTTKRDDVDPLFGRIGVGGVPRPELEKPQPSTIADIVQRQFGYFTGEKFAGGFGPTQHLLPDYWELRARSAQLFRTNLYARGIIARLLTNEINTGLHLEATPEEKILGLAEDSLADWSEDVETRWELWAKDPFLCDHREAHTFGVIQRAAREEALISGDVLVVLRQDQRTGLPRPDLISGWAIQSPMQAGRSSGPTIKHGIELDANKRQVAYYVRQDDGTTKRLPAYGEKSGRRLAWMYYGGVRRLDEVRGEPLLAIILQSLKEIDRYRDSAQRKAVINSTIALFIKKLADKPGSLPFTMGATRAGNDPVQTNDGTTRSFRAAEQIPGLIFEDLQQGEEPVGFPSHGTDEKFSEFEETIIQACAWCNEIPPEILQLSFSNNYSASQAAINEFKMYLNRIRTRFGDEFCAPIYNEWLLASVLQQKIKADGFLEAWRDIKKYDIAGAWTSCDWSGHIKPAVDQSKLVDGYDKQVAGGYMTRDRASRELNGSKFSRNVKRLRLEAVQLAAARAPLLEQEAALKPQPSPPPSKAQDPQDGTTPNNPDNADPNGDSAARALRVAS